jgi:hypothetical protein
MAKAILTCIRCRPQLQFWKSDVGRGQGSAFQLRPNGPEEAQALVAFESWFTRERPRLEQESAKEISRLNDLAAELDTRIVAPVIGAAGARNREW